MQKFGIIVVISGVLIVIGLVLLAFGNQVILEGVNQGNGKVSLNQDIIISADFNSQESSAGVFVVQIMEFKENTFSARILDPFDIEIESQSINQETFEKEFGIFENGNYKLVIQSNNDEEAQVFGAIGPLPDESKKSLSYVSVYVIIIGMSGLLVMGIYKIKNRKGSV